MTPKADPALFALRRLLARVKIRVWQRQCGSALQRLVPLQLAAIATWFGAEWLAPMDSAISVSTRWVVLGAIVVLPGLLAAVRTICRKLPKFAVSLSIDRYLGSGDLLTSALCFSERPHPTPIERLVIRQAVELGARVEPRQVVPLSWAPRLWLLLATTVALGALVPERPSGDLARMSRPFRSEVEQGTVPAPIRAETEHIRLVLADLERTVETSEAKGEVERLQALLEAYARGQLERDALERHFATAGPGMESLAQLVSLEFSGIAGALERQTSTQALASALRKGQLADAVLALEALQRRWREPRTKPTAEALAALRKAVEADRADRQRQKSQRIEERAQIATQRDELLHQRRSRDKNGGIEQRIDSLSRRLEQLDRKRQAADRAEPALSALDRAISQATRALADELARNRSDAFQGFDQARIELQRLNRFAQSEADRRELLQKIQQIREILRKGGRADDNRVVTWVGFDRRANGSGSERGARGSSSAVLEAQPSPTGTALLMGAGEAPPELGATAASDPQNGADDSSKSRSRAGGSAAAGDRHDSELRGAAQGLETLPSRDATAVTDDTGSGAVSPEVVAVAAQRGFVGRQYQRVFRAYMPVAESLLGQSDVPSSHKAQVRRYFQLLRPREEPP